MECGGKRKRDTALDLLIDCNLKRRRRSALPAHLQVGTQPAAQRRQKVARGGASEASTTPGSPALKTTSPERATDKTSQVSSLKIQVSSPKSQVSGLKSLCELELWRRILRLG